MSFKILTDTSCNLPMAQIRQYDLTLAPLHYLMDGKEYSSYTDGEMADFKAFYDAVGSGTIVTTNCVNQAVAQETLESVVSQGNDVLVLAFSSGLSATFDSWNNATRDVAAKHPERKVYCIDTLQAASGQGLVITYADKLRGEGKTIDEVREWLEANIQTFCTYFTVDDLMFLMRGGRLKKSSAILGTALKIKPVMHVDAEGKLAVVEKTRGRKKAIAGLAERIGMSLEHIPAAEQIIQIAHGDCYEETKELADYLVATYGVPEPLISYVDPVIGAHTGPGVIAVAFRDIPEHR